MSDFMRNRRKNVLWEPPNTWQVGVPIQLLMDIRDELQKLNRVFECTNFLRIPRDLRQIRLNTTKKKRQVKK